MSPTRDPDSPLALKPPATRALQGYRGVWWSLLVETPRQLRKIQTVRRGLRGLSGRRR